jgi:hypothetical protein
LARGLRPWLEDFDPGPRTSTLARGLRPVQVFFSANARARVSGKTGPRTWTHPPGVLQRGNTTGKQKGNTTRKKWKNEKTKKIEKSHL